MSEIPNHSYCCFLLLFTARQIVRILISLWPCFDVRILVGMNIHPETYKIVKIWCLRWHIKRTLFCFFREVWTLNDLRFFSHYMSVFVFQVLSSFSSYMTARHKEMFSLQVSTQSLCEPMPSKSSKQSTNYTTGIVPRTYISQFILSPQPWKREGKKKSPCILETWKLKLIEFIFYIAPESFLQSWSVDNKASMW